MYSSFIHCFWVIFMSIRYIPKALPFPTPLIAICLRTAGWRYLCSLFEFIRMCCCLFAWTCSYFYKYTIHPTIIASSSWFMELKSKWSHVSWTHHSSAFSESVSPLSLEQVFRLLNIGGNKIPLKLNVKGLFSLLIILRIYRVTENTYMKLSQTHSPG